MLATLNLLRHKLFIQNTYKLYFTLQTFFLDLDIFSFLILDLYNNYIIMHIR